MNRSTTEASRPSHQEESFENVSDMANYFDHQIQDIIQYNQTDEQLLPRRLAQWRGMRTARRETQYLVEGLRRWLQRSLDGYLTTDLTNDWLKAISVLSYIAENLVHRSMSALLFEQLAAPLLDIASVHMPTSILFRVLPALDCLANHTPRPIREALFPTLQQHIRGMASWLVRCGDYQTQYNMLTVLAHLVPSERAARVNAAHAIFCNDLNAEAFDVFIIRDFSNLEMHTLEFLHIVNAMRGLVVHVLCEAILLDGNNLIGVNGIEGDPLYMELNKGSGSVTVDCFDRCVMRASNRTIQQARMLRDADGKAVIEIIAPVEVSQSQGCNPVNVLRAFPSVGLAEADAALRDMYGERYKCVMVIDESSDLNTKPRKPTYLEVGSRLSLVELDELVVDETPEVTEETIQPVMRRCNGAVWHGAESRSRAPSTVSTTSTPSISKLRQKCETSENVLNMNGHQKFPKKNFTAVLEPVHEPSFRANVQSSHMLTRNATQMNQNISEVSDIQLVNDLYDAALSGSLDVQEDKNKQNSTKDEETVTGAKHSKKKHLSIKENNNNSVKEAVPAKIPVIETEAIINKENTAVNVQNVLKTASNETNKSTKRSTVTKTEEVSMMLSKNQNHNIHDTITAEAAIEDSTNDYISDTPNVMNTHFQNISSKKKLNQSPNIIEQSIQSMDYKPACASKRRNSKVKDKETVQKKSKKNSDSDCPLGSENFKATFKVSSTTIGSMSESSRENPIITDVDSKRKRRKLYSPNSDFLQNNITENCEIHNDRLTLNFEDSEIENKRTKPNNTPYISVKRKQFNDEIFDQLASTNNETTKSTKRSKDFFNISNDSDSESDFKFKKSFNINSSLRSKATKMPPKNHTKSIRKKYTKTSKKKNKLGTVQKTSNISMPLLTDEKMRKVVPAEDLLNVSFENKTIQRINIDEEEILPVGLDTIEIQEIQHSYDHSLKPKDRKISRKSNKDDMIGQPGVLDTSEIQEITLTNGQSTIDLGYESLKRKDRTKELKKKFKSPKVNTASIGRDAIEIQDIPHVTDPYKYNTRSRSQSKGQSEEIKKKSISVKQDPTQKTVHNKDDSKTSETASKSLKQNKTETMKMKCERKTKAKVNVEPKTFKKQLEDEFSSISTTPPPLLIELEEHNKLNDLTINFNTVVENALTSLVSESETGIKERQIMNDIMLPDKTSSSSLPKSRQSVIDLVSFNDNDAQQFSTKRDILEPSRKSIEFVNDVSEINSSPKTVSGSQNGKTFPTVGRSPITAHMDSEEEPPSVSLLEERVQGRVLETETLDRSERYFIEKLRDLNSQSAQGASDVEEVFTEARKTKSSNSLRDISDSTPKKSYVVSNKSKMPLYPHTVLESLSVEGASDVIFSEARESNRSNSLLHIRNTTPKKSYAASNKSKMTLNPHVVLEPLSFEGASDVVFSEARVSNGSNSLRDVRNSTPKKSYAASNKSNMLLNPHVVLDDISPIKLPEPVQQTSKRNLNKSNPTLKSIHQSCTPTARRPTECPQSSGFEQVFDSGFLKQSSSSSQVPSINLTSSLQVDIQPRRHLEHGEPSLNNAREWIRSHPPDSEQTQVLVNISPIKLPGPDQQTSKRNLNKSIPTLKSIHQSCTPTVQRPTECQLLSDFNEVFGSDFPMQISSSSQNLSINLTSSLQADIQPRSRLDHLESCLNNAREWIFSHPPDSEQTRESALDNSMSEVIQMMLQSIQTGFTEDNHVFKNGMVSAVAEILKAYKDTEREFQAKYESLSRERFEQHRRNFEAYKVRISDLMKQHDRRCTARVTMLTEDIQQMLRRYRRSTGRNIRVRTEQE